MLFHHIKFRDQTILGIWKTEENVDTLSKFLSEQTLSDKTYLTFTNDSRKQEWLAVRVLLKTILQDEKQVAYAKNGAPYLVDMNYNISISHTKAYVAVLLHPLKRVGIDIEFKSNRILKLREKFLSPSELSEDALTCLLYWSAKETLFKILPEDTIDFKDHLHINPFTVQEKGSFKTFETRTQDKQEFMMHYEVFDDFVLTWCTK